jgi:hypothetical protein
MLLFFDGRSPLREAPFLLLCADGVGTPQGRLGCTKGSRAQMRLARAVMPAPKLRPKPELEPVEDGFVTLLWTVEVLREEVRRLSESVKILYTILGKQLPSAL